MSGLLVRSLMFAALSFAASRVTLWLVSRDDPEGANLLIVTVLALVIFIFLQLVYILCIKKRKK